MGGRHRLAGRRGVQRELLGQLAYLGLHAGDRGVVLLGQHGVDEVGDLEHLRLREAARRHAGVPMRTPLVTNGDCGSPGMVFLFTVMPARSSSACASFPVRCLGRRSTSMRWVSVPPETMA